MRIFSQSYMNRVFGHQMLGNAVVASQMTFTVLANCHVAFRAFEEYALNYRGCKVSDAARNTSFRFMRTLTDSRLVMMSRSPSDEKPKCQVGWTSSVFLRNMRLLDLAYSRMCIFLLPLRSLQLPYFQCLPASLSTPVYQRCPTFLTIKFIHPKHRCGVFDRVFSSPLVCF
jgi:hypothetical protein